MLGPLLPVQYEVLGGQPGGQVLVSHLSTRESLPRAPVVPEVKTVEVKAAPVVSYIDADQPEVFTALLNPRPKLRLHTKKLPPKLPQGHCTEAHLHPHHIPGVPVPDELAPLQQHCMAGGGAPFQGMNSKIYDTKLILLFVVSWTLQEHFI